MPFDIMFQIGINIFMKIRSYHLINHAVNDSSLAWSLSFRNMVRMNL